MEKHESLCFSNPWKIQGLFFQTLEKGRTQTTSSTGIVLFQERDFATISQLYRGE